MNLEKLPKQVARSKKRLGRGIGSGKGGHTSSRGQKGQKTRNRMGLFFEGTKIKKSLLKRLPLLPGKGKFKPGKRKSIVVNLKYLNLFSDGSVVDLENLIKNQIVSAREAKKFGVKILGDGDLTKKLTVNLPVSQGAREKIEKAGGKVLEVEKRKRSKVKAKINPK